MAYGRIRDKENERKKAPPIWLRTEDLLFYVALQLKRGSWELLLFHEPQIFG